MTIRLQPHDTELQVSPEESWNVNLLTMVLKLLMALVVLIVAMIASIVS